MRRWLAIIGLLAIYHFFFFSLGLPWIGSLGFVSLYLVLTIFIWFSLLPASLEHLKNRQALAATSLGLLFIAFSLFRSSEVDRVLLSFSALSLLGVSTYLLALTHSAYGSLTEAVLTPVSLLFAWLSQAGRLLTALTAQFANTLKRHPTSDTQYQAHLISALFRGAAITLPAAFILLILLSSADLVFREVILDVINLNLFTLPPQLRTRLVATLLILIFSIPLAYLSISRRFSSPLNLPSYGHFTLEMLMLTGTTGAILAAFLAIESPYLFAQVSEIELSRFGVFTYSEYVRRGFVELALVTAITYTIAGLAYLVSRARDHTHRLLRNSNLTLLGLNLVFVLSIFRRLYLYQLHHGLSRSRLYGAAFLIFIIGLILILALRHFTRKYYFYLWETGLAVLIIAFITLANVDAIIATRYPPTVNNQVDYTYITRLSPAAVAGWLDAHRDTQAWVRSHPELVDATTLSPEIYREFYYHRFSLQNLLMQLIRLTPTYGTQPQLDRLSTLGNLYHSTPELDPHTAYHTNFSDRTAFRHFLSQADIDSMVADYHLLDQAYHRIPKPINATLDRSTESPLID